MRSQSGFTMIELVVVIVVLGILAAVAIPKYVDMQAEALAASQAGMSGAVKSAHSLVVAQKALNGDSPVWPTIAEVVAGVSGENVSVEDTGYTGVNVVIDGTTYVVPTYTDSTCTTATGAATDTVQCVGSI